MMNLGLRIAAVGIVDPVRARRSPNLAGFTLIELVMVVAIVGVLSTVVSHMMLSAHTAYTEASTRSRLVGETDWALQRLTREIREIGNNSGNADITTANVSLLHFGTTQIQLASGTIQIREGAGGFKGLLEDVTSLTFAYFDEANTALTSTPLVGANRDNVRRVSITIVQTVAGDPITMRTKVYLRNFMGS